MRHPRLHGAGAGQHLGHEDEVFAKLDADDPHAGDQPVVHDLQRLDAVVERLAGERVDLVVVALDDSGGDVLHQRPGAREQRDSALDLLRAFEIFRDFLADEFVGDIAEFRHGAPPSPRLVERRARGVPVAHRARDLEQVLDRGL